mgnify:CR=1 FL=1
MCEQLSYSTKDRSAFDEGIWIDGTCCMLHRSENGDEIHTVGANSSSSPNNFANSFSDKSSIDRSFGVVGGNTQSFPHFC